MGKAFKSQTCVYCADVGIGHTADHIFAREFFPLHHRRDLPKVPACSACNAAKSALEHYLTAVLPIAGRNNAASDVTTVDVPGRLARNARLQAELTAGQDVALISTGGQAPEPEMVLPLRTADFIGLHQYLVRGLAAFHFQTIIPRGHYVGAGALTQAGERIILGLFGHQARARVQKATRGRVFEYTGAQAFDDPALTIWCFKAYGGLRLAGDASASREVTSRIWAMSARTPLTELFSDHNRRSAK